MRHLLLWTVPAISLFVPVDIIRIIAAFFLITFFPGALIWSFLNAEEKNPLFFLLCGSAFLTTLVYFCSWFIFYPIPLVLSFLSVLILEKKKIPLSLTRGTVYLIVCILFMLACLYPWKAYVHFFPPGDEMKLHLLYTYLISTEKALPSTYAPLYPEIVGITQPLGFHGVTSFVAGAARASIIPASTFLGMVMASLACVSVYFLGKTLFSEKIGIYSSLSFSFLSFVFHQLGLSGSYVILAGFTFQIGAAALLVQAAQKKTRSSYVLAGIFCAACFATDLNAFFTLLFFFFLLLLLNRSIFPVIAAFILFSLPHLARITISMPTPLEVHFIQDWFVHSSPNTLHSWYLALFSLGPLLLICALLQLSSRNPDKSLLNLGIYAIPLFVPLLSYYLPFWYFLDPLPIFRMVSIPLSVLSGLFLLQLKEYKWFLPGLLVFSALLQAADPLTILPSPSVTVDADSLSAFEWISENVPPDSVILNFTSYGDSSTWIPAVTGRAVFFPFHLFYKRDNCMARLKLPERFTDVQVVKAFPASGFSNAILEKNRIQYVYVEREMKDRFSHFTEEFHQGNVYVFSVPEKGYQCESAQYYQGGRIIPGRKSYSSLSNVRGDMVGIYYEDSGFGNVDVEINGKYVGTIFRFDSGEHFFILFSFPSENAVVSFLPYEDTFFIEYIVVFACEQGRV